MEDQKEEKKASWIILEYLRFSKPKSHCDNYFMGFAPEPLGAPWA